MLTWFLFYKERIKKLMSKDLVCIEFKKLKRRLDVRRDLWSIAVVLRGENSSVGKFSSQGEVW